MSRSVLGAKSKIHRHQNRLYSHLEVALVQSTSSLTTMRTREKEEEKGSSAEEERQKYDRKTGKRLHESPRTNQLLSKKPMLVSSADNCVITNTKSVLGKVAPKLFLVFGQFLT